MDMQFKSSMLEYRGEFNNNWPIELTNITGTRLEDINDDCLLEIFSSNSLDLLDLCALAETCNRFHYIAQRIFPKSLTVEKNGLFIVDSGRYYGQQFKALDFKRVMTYFGSTVTDFSITERISRCRRERGSLDCVFTNGVTENFFDNLKCLHIHGFKMPACTDRIRDIFKRLQLLDLQWVSSSDPTLFEGLDSLVELRVMQVESCGAILENVFPKLERFAYFTTDIRMPGTNSIRHANLDQSFNTLLAFISRHNGLKAMDLCFYSHSMSLMFLLEAIGNNCKNLDELWIRVGLPVFTSDHLQPLQKFESLRTLGLSEVPCGSFQFTAGLNKLQELHLCGCSLPRDSNLFVELAQIRKLVINNCTAPDRFDVVLMIERLRCLEELTISWLYIQKTRFKLSINSFDRIVGVVMDRPQVLTLNCEYCFDLKSSEMSPKILLFYYIGD